MSGYSSSSLGNAPSILFKWHGGSGLNVSGTPESVTSRWHKFPLPVRIQALFGTAVAAFTGTEGVIRIERTLDGSTFQAYGRAKVPNLAINQILWADVYHTAGDQRGPIKPGEGVRLVLEAATTAGSWAVRPAVSYQGGQVVNVAPF